MIYPFRFKLGDAVQVMPTVKVVGGRRGTVTALELNRRGTVAVINWRDPELQDGRVFRVSESQLIAQ